VFDIKEDAILSELYYFPLLLYIIALWLMYTGLKRPPSYKKGCFNSAMLMISLITGLLSTFAVINYFTAHKGLDNGAMAYSFYVLLFLPCAIIFNLSTKQKG